ncbi:N-6 DNA methylase [Campylobacter helveticus]|uniref:N-6 DNA methylase n=1 Tax=Campylobacter helveticus TaxID=28898 RepID=UPI00214A3AF4|nr:N-6 DNA methylase [Campylobacter helveticus]MCR2057008.1 N-6 DNA methylase [Campylobacter helveticus]MCR2066823.1 N-6 DNA methylase [Campylobacter helveticus]
MEFLKPQICDSIADLACGTGGFITAAAKFLNPQSQTVDNREKFENSFYGCEKKSLPYLLCALNFLIKGIENPSLKHENAFDFEKGTWNDLSHKKKFDFILMNPPYGGKEKRKILRNFLLNLKARRLQIYLWHSSQKGFHTKDKMQSCYLTAFSLAQIMQRLISKKKAHKRL